MYAPASERFAIRVYCQIFLIAIYLHYMTVSLEYFIRRDLTILVPINCTGVSSLVFCWCQVISLLHVHQTLLPPDGVNCLMFLCSNRARTSGILGCGSITGIYGSSSQQISRRAMAATKRFERKRACEAGIWSHEVKLDLASEVRKQWPGVSLRPGQHQRDERIHCLLSRRTRHGKLIQLSTIQVSGFANVSKSGGRAAGRAFLSVTDGWLVVSQRGSYHRPRIQFGRCSSI